MSVDTFNRALIKIKNARGRWQSIENPSELRSLVNQHGDSLLHILAAEGDLEATRLLLRLGLDVNQPNRFGTTPLLAAAWKEHYGVLQLLMDAGADIHAKDSTDFSVIENLELLNMNKVVEWLVNRQ